MAHQPWHPEFGFPGYGSPGFGSAVGQALQSQAPMGLLEPGPYPEPPGAPPMQSGVSPRQSGFTGSLDWDVVDGNIYDSLGASVTETEEERRRREREERDQRNALASGFGRASEMLLAGGRREPPPPMANIGFPGYAALGGRSGRFA